MNFSLTEEQESVRKMVRKFVDREIIPSIQEWDEKGHFERGILKRLSNLELMGVGIPEKYGGVGMDYNTLAIVCDELERGDTAFRTALSVHTGLNSMTILQWGNESQKEKYLVPQARGQKIGAFGLTEPNTGSDVAALQTTARREGNKYVLNGYKTWISLCDVADHFLIFAKTDNDKNHHGISCFIVERTFPGLTTKAIKGNLGIRAGNTGEVFLEEVHVPAENLLGEEGEGLKIAMSALDHGSFTVAAGACGLINACLEESIKYCHELKTFGKEIGKPQLVQQMIAKMSANLEISRQIVYRAGSLKNEGEQNTHETSIAKWFACDAAIEAANDAIQIHRAYEYSNEYSVERFLRNAKAPDIYEATREIHTITEAEYTLGYREDKPISKKLPSWPFVESLETSK
ncbi:MULTISPECIES: acyl-CoA dehydrogenase family protein [Bacillaceae]|uniref:Butyryl-CoA dehydrogenase n=1 Tax=Gottfriedia luciferensis TaxID=178774 RepID=A0ABX2ZS90_9BACI|nr:MULTISPECIES: acyl-CoA dehydrogenase family protein [Bacillaceae]ODG92618.1 butyryl-CoA dehydrogenase [Gottfriedia luciferensis]PGZ93189.1 butyryl-CoA dehydrogenase [Bacillus sp. AFS029533]